MSKYVVSPHPSVEGLAGPEPTLCTATIVDGSSLRAETAEGAVEVTRAKSCLVAPAVGDRVLLVRHETGAHVLAVLGSEEATTRIAPAGDLELSSAGRVVIDGEEGIDLRSKKTAQVQARAFSLEADDASVAVKALGYVGREVVTRIDQVKTVTRSVEQIADRLVQRLERAYRYVNQHEQVRADYIDYGADTAVHIRGKTTIIKSADLTKVDGGQIHVG